MALRRAATGMRLGTAEIEVDAFVPYLINHISNRLNLSLLEELRPLRITPQRWRVLLLLHDRDGRSITDLAQACAMEQPTLSRVVDQLERDGLARRQVQTTDGRVTGVWLTAGGSALFERVRPVAKHLAERATLGFSPAEREVLLRLLGRMRGNLARPGRQQVVPPR